MRTFTQARRQHLRDYQLATVQGLLRGILLTRATTFTVMFPRQSGKNEVSAELVAALLRLRALDGGTIILCAPTFSPQARISMERTFRALAAPHPTDGASLLKREGTTLRLGNASAVFLSASPAAHVAGHTASIALLVDEAQEIDDAWFERQFRPMTASTGAPVVMFGTAWDGESLFERTADRNRDVDRVGHESHRRRHWQVSWQEVGASRPAYDAFVRAERERLGETNPLFLSQYELRAGAAAGRLLSPAQLLMLEAPHPRLWAPVRGERYVAGLDLGGDGAGADSTVLTIARVDGRRCEVVQHVAANGATFALVEREVAALTSRWRLTRLCIDGTGLGAMLAASLASDFGETVERVTFSSTVKSELGFALIAACEGNRVGLYETDGSVEAHLCRSELRECRARRPSANRLIWGNDAGHDDYAISLALCLRAAEHAGPLRIARGRP
jgi:hypothetical protein